MCLQLTKFSRLHIAAKDKVVYKIVQPDPYVAGKYITPYMSFSVEIGNTYRSRLTTNKEDSFFFVECEKGLHSCKTVKGLKAITKYHSRSLPVKCLIPKGSYYYKGLFGGKPAYASDCITYVEFIDPSVLSITD